MRVDVVVVEVDVGKFGEDGCRRNPVTTEVYGL